MNESFIYSIGAILNALVFFYCCKKWKTVGNIKFLVAIHAALSVFLTISANLELLKEKVGGFSKGNFFCHQMPSLVIFVLCFSTLNLTCLVCVKYAQCADNFYLRRSFAMLIILAVFVLSILLCSPILCSINIGWPLVLYPNKCMENKYNVSDIEAAKKVHIDAVRYLFWFIVLQFLVPAFIIANRMILILIHLWQEETTTDTIPNPIYQVTIRYTVNVVFATLFAIVTVSISLKSLDVIMDSDEALDFLNALFQKFAVFYLDLFSALSLVLEGYIILKCSGCPIDEENSCLIPKDMEQYMQYI